ncbi:MAG: ATP-binding cassette domain-containing protein, partial [Lachnospiraceae bacterium]|nr:ATP-binding cassette domain-containing protein [Lachnospiraceae bacterium]
LSLTDGIHAKLDKQVNENGIELSGGELQKLMLARALYKDAPVLVLDEPTAALDPIAESKIYEEYKNMTAGKSSLFISHRLASTRFCDRILYLKDGRIAEEGSHDALVAAGGEYAKLYEIQSCWYQEDGMEGQRQQEDFS